MFKRNTKNLGASDLIVFQNQDDSFRLEIIPSAGANVRSLKIKGVNIIDGVESDEELKNNVAYKSTILAPFPNRIKDGKYEFRGKTYQLNINETPRNNALHGLIYNAPFEVLEEVVNDKNVSITLKNEYTGGNPGYPFPFTTTTKIVLDVDKGFTCTLSFRNLSDTEIPFGYGWHPYFTLNGKVDSYKLKTPATKQFMVDKQMIPTGASTEFHSFDELNPLKDIQLDGCFEIVEKNQVAETILKNGDGVTLKLWQETGHKKLNYLQIYTPPHGNSIAIEPQTCCIDAFNNREGLFYLQENEMLESSFGIILSLD